jgi:hypothetical protein
VNGPYQTEREARAAVQHITASPAGSWGDGMRRLLEDACRAAGVQPGAYDHRIIGWLAGYEPQMCAVVAGLISRAAAGRLAGDRLATVLDALDVAADELRERAANCGDCDAHPAGLCTTCESRLARAEGFDQAARALGGAR